MYNYKETGNNRNKEICDKYGKCEVYSGICKDEKFDKTHNEMMSKQVIKNYFKKFIKQDIRFFLLHGRRLATHHSFTHD